MTITKIKFPIRLTKLAVALNIPAARLIPIFKSTNPQITSNAKISIGEFNALKEDIARIPNVKKKRKKNSLCEQPKKKVSKKNKNKKSPTSAWSRFSSDIEKIQDASTRNQYPKRGKQPYAHIISTPMKG